MDILAIETSCDETAAAVVADSGDSARPWTVRSNVVASQADIHREWGGVVPELASRQHVRDICGVVERALDDARAGWADIDAVAVTQGPGLVGSLLVGVAFAKALAASLDVPLVPVQHLAGHIESLVVEGGPMPLPAVVLVVSGGHTNLYLTTRGGRGGTVAPVDRPDARRCGRRGLRQGRLAPRARLSGRTGDRSAGAHRRRPGGRFPLRPHDARRSQRRARDGSGRPAWPRRAAAGSSSSASAA